ncbi:MAG TPA: hypothetical protein VFC63_07275 [Blastocatellia bacterium]|nr:hypothetical protein [Blastocatellia bacterium]
MRLGFIVSLCALLSFVSTGVLAYRDQNQTTVSPDQRESGTSLTLKAGILKKEYCRDFSVEQIKLGLHLTYLNTGNNDIVLDRTDVHIQNHRIGKTERLLASGKSEFDCARDITDMIVNPRQKPNPPDDTGFVVLKPGESFVSQTTMFIFFKIRRSRYIISPGSHVLDVTISTWKYSEDLIPSFRTRFDQKGYLWTNSLTSQPLHFTIEAKADDDYGMCFPEAKGKS